MDAEAGDAVLEALAVVVEGDHGADEFMRKRGEWI